MKNRFRMLADRLPAAGLDGLLLTGEANRFYASGFLCADGMAVITKEKSYYFTDSRYIEAAEAAVSGAEVLLISRERSYHAALGQAVAAHGIKKLGFEENRMTVGAYRALAGAVRTELVPAQSLPGKLRAAKDVEEIGAITAAQRIAERALDKILGFLRPGLTEKEVAAELTYQMLRLGAEKMSFDPIVVSGPNSSMPHGVPTDRKLAAGEFLTMDFGCVSGGYCSDMTRTVALGSADSEMRKVYDTVLRAQMAGITAAKAGVTGRSIDGAARKVIEDAGYGDCFGHGFGHSVGIEIHESPNAAPGDQTEMPEGAVVTAEPGIYLPGRFGVRIEDMMILREDGCQVITRVPKELLVL